MRRHGVDLCAQPAAAVAKRLMLSFFVGIGTVLVGSHNGAVDHRVFVVGVAGQMLKDALPHASLGPAAEPPVRILPIILLCPCIRPRAIFLLYKKSGRGRKNGRNLALPAS